jgi:PAS domain S-box-containing protein
MPEPLTYQELTERVQQLELACEQLKQNNLRFQEQIQATDNQLLVGTEPFKLMADNIPVIIWTADENGIVDYFNKRWFDYTGAPPGEYSWASALHPEDEPRTIEVWSESVAQGVTYYIEYRIRRASDGEYRWFLGKAQPLRDHAGNVVKWFGTCTDINEQKLSDKRKDEFLSIASHELKTPLTSVKAFLQLGKKSIAETEPGYRFVDKASMQLNRLEKLISDLLDVSKINAGKMVYNYEEFDFNDALRESVDSIQQTFPDHQIIIEQSESVNYKGDRLRLEQVMNNLLNNAVKYSPEANKVIIKSEIQQNNLVISVQDFGIGIAPENLAHLFDRYYRVDNTAMRFQGLGLGLFISSEIIKRHNGSFWIESEPGKGSTFYFLLPISGKQELIDIETDGRTFYRGNFIEIKYNPELNWLEASWLGYQNYESVKKGCLIMLDLLKKNRCTKVLNDNTLVMGNWSEAVDWGGQVWFPAMEAAGLQHFAWIYSPSTFSKMSAEKSIDLAIGQITARFFTEITEASEWLQNA